MSPWQKVIQNIREKVRRAKSKADVKAAFEDACRQICKEAVWELPFHSEHDRTLIKAGPTDALFDHLVLEYEQPGKLQTSNDAPSNREKIERLTAFLQSHSRDEKRLWAGVLTDGRHILFIRPHRGELIPTGPQTICADSMGTLINLIEALSRKRLSLDGIIRDFGAESDVARHGVNTLLIKAIDTSHPKTDILFREWMRILGIIVGEEIPKEKEKSRVLTKLYNIDKRTPLRPLLFSIHAYSALWTKLLAADLLGRMKDRPSLTQELIHLDDTSLKERLEAFEGGEYFASLGVTGFLKGNLFSWYVDAWDAPCAEMVRRICEALNRYEPLTVTFFPQQTRNLLKTFNQHLMPSKLRLNLGEHFTPDWLAERLLNQVGYDGNPDKRILDPCCGSGTFLALSIDRIHQFVEDHFGRYPDKRVVLEKVLQNVIGFDINPLSVITARTNYLMALSHLLDVVKDDIQIPVYCSDSLRVPVEQVELFFEGYVLPTAAGTLPIPSEIVQKDRVHKMTSLLDESVRLQSGVDIFLERAKRSCELNDKEFEMSKPGLIHVYRMMLNLHREGKNGFWTGVIENAFVPVLVDPFDFIVGNPPWVNWENLTSEYRKATQPLWSKYELQAKSGGVQFEVGKQKRDLALLFSFVNTDSHLKEKGRLAFIIANSILKSEGGEAFRRFQVDQNTPIKVIHVDDFDTLQPMDDSTIKPSVIVLQKGASTNYPVPYTLWRKKKSHTFSSASSLHEVFGATQRVNLYANPVQEGNTIAPWITARSKALKALQKMMGISNYHPRSGISTWANGIYLVRIVSEQSDHSIIVENLYQIGRRSVPRIQKAIEPHLLYPVLRGQEISRWQHQSQFYLILPHDQGTTGQTISEGDMAKSYPKTYAYFEECRDLLTSRSGYVRLRKGFPFFTIGNVTSEVFANFKVVWKRSRDEISCCVVGDKEDRFLNRKTILPIESVTMVSFETHEEAHFFCALMNSSLLQAVLKTYSFHHSGASGSPNILEHIGIPRYHRSNAIQRQLAELSLQAHRLVSLRQGENASVSAQGNKEGLFLKEIEEEIDKKTAELWDFTEGDVAEMKRSLRELS